MNPMRLVAFSSLLFVGCAKPVPVAEGDCADLLKEAFRDADFTDEDGETNLQSILLGINESCMVNLDAKYKDRQINPGVLTADFLDGLPQPEGTTLEDQTPVGVPGRSRHPIQDHITAMADTNQNCMGSGSTKYNVREFTSGGDCFFDGSCQAAESTARSFTKNPLVKVWIDSFADWHRTTIPAEDGDIEAVVSRGWTDQVFFSGMEGDGGSSWRQRYALDIWLSNPANADETLRFYMFWSEADIQGVGDDLYVSLVAEGLDENFVNVDTFLDGDVCDERDWDEARVREEYK